MRRAGVATAICLLAACRGPVAPAPDEAWLPLPFAVERLHGRGTVLVAGGAHRSVVVAGRDAVWLPHAADAVAAAGGALAVLDRSREELSIVEDGAATTYCFPAAGPRAVAMSADGRGCAVRTEEALLERWEGGRWRVAHDARLDPALPGPSWAFTQWAADHGSSGDDESRVPDALREPGGTRSVATVRHEGARSWVVLRDGDRELRRIEAAAALWFPHGGQYVPLVGTREGLVALAPSLPRARARAPVAGGGSGAVVVALPAVPDASEAPDGPLLHYLLRHPGDPRGASLWGEHGRRLRQAGRTPEALVALQRATRLAGGGRGRDRSLDFELVEMHRQRGEHEQAVSELGLLVRRLSDLPDDPAVFDAKLLMAEILSQRLARHGEAVPIYEELVARYETYFPDDASGFRRAKARLFMGLALEGLGRRAEALHQYDAIPRESSTGAFVRYAGERAARIR